MGLWQRLTHRRPDEGVDEVPSRPLRRDPDLDAMHRVQHDLMNRTGYTGQRVRDSWNERVRRSWNPDAG